MTEAEKPPYMVPDLGSLQPIIDHLTNSPMPEGKTYMDIHRLVLTLTSFAENAIFNYNLLREANGEPPLSADDIRAMGVQLIE